MARGLTIQNCSFDVKTSRRIGFHGDKERDLVMYSLGKATSQQVLKFVPFLQVKALRDARDENALSPTGLRSTL